MERLHFGARARRRAKLRRLAVWAWIVSSAAAAIGIPGFTSSSLIDRLTGRAELLQRSGAALPASKNAVAALRFRQGVFENRPIPQPPSPEDPTIAAVPSAPITGSGSTTEVITAAAQEFGLDPNYLIGVAYCESRLSPGAVGSGGYYGLFQFDQSTWATYGYGSTFDPVAQARTAARLLAAGQASRWPNCA